MSHTIYLWDREDGSKIKAVGRDREVPFGKVYAVDPAPGRGVLSDRARVTLAVSRRELPADDEVEAGRIRSARARVKLRDEQPSPLAGEITWADEAPGGGE